LSYARGIVSIDDGIYAHILPLPVQFIYSSTSAVNSVVVPKYDAQGTENYLYLDMILMLERIKT